MLAQREKLIEISHTLAKAHEELAKAKMGLLVTESDITNRKLTLAPAEGWPGKNVEERTQAKQQAFDQDKILAQLVKEQTGLQLAIIEANGVIDAHAALRRGLEYSINDLYLEMLSGQFTKAILGEAAGAFTDATADIADPVREKLELKMEPANEWVSEADNQGPPVAPVHGSSAFQAQPSKPEEGYFHGVVEQPEETIKPSEPAKTSKAKASKAKEEPKPKATGPERIDDILKELGF